MQKAINYIDEYAKKNNIPIIGSFNPEDLGLKNTDFYDAAHARKEVVDKLLQNLRNPPYTRSNSGGS